MRFFYFTMAAAALLSVQNAAFADVPDGEDKKIEKLDSVIVSASRADSSTPVAFTMVDGKELRSSNPINSLPMTLNLQPSVVTYNEGGTGLGNSAMTIRGSKGSQINVTLNGITLNDSESQEVFWVNIPSLQSLISSVQVQRGLGTTANGSGAFGASINMSTASVSAEPFARAEFSTGSWNTSLTTVSAGSGILPGGFYVNAAYSRGNTDGYIRNAKVASQSAFAVIGWLSGNNSLRLTYLLGDQKSGITWDGIDLDTYYTDRRHNDAGAYYDDMGNLRYYDNQIDRYTQHHIQLNYTRRFSDALTWSNTLNYTRGDGYDEYYKSGMNVLNYGFGQTVTGSDGNTYESSDIIYRKEMGNDYYVFNTALKYNSDVLDLTAGGSVSRYCGDHFGTVLWLKVLGDGYDYDGFNDKDPWYRNVGNKTDASVYVRGEWSPSELVTAYFDMQYRHVGLEMSGRDDDALEKGGTAVIDYGRNWNFFNPHAGVTFRWNEHHKSYFSAAIGHREPGRSDIKENIKDVLSPLKPEKMLDLELGYSYSGERFRADVNLYAMEYKDMLLETGRLSTSGYAIKDNVSRGFRRGVEVAAAWIPLRWLSVDGNATFSTNRIKDYVSYVEVWDGEPGETRAYEYGDTDMLLSPSVVGMLRACVTPWKGIAHNSLKTTTFTIDGKYVGRQYIDNTMRDAMKIPAYFVANLSVSHEFSVGGGKLGLAAYVNNLFNNLYYAYGWRYEGCYSDASKPVEYGVGVYPQPETNFMLKVSYSF